MFTNNKCNVEQWMNIFTMFYEVVFIAIKYFVYAIYVNDENAFNPHPASDPAHSETFWKVGVIEIRSGLKTGKCRVFYGLGNNGKY